MFTKKCAGVLKFYLHSILWTWVPTVQEVQPYDKFSTVQIYMADC